MQIIGGWRGPMAELGRRHTLASGTTRLDWDPQATCSGSTGGATAGTGTLAAAAF